MVALLDRLSTNFAVGVRIRAEPTQGDTGIVAVRENIDTQIKQCRRMAGEGAGLRHVARVMSWSPATVKKTLRLGCSGNH